MRGLSLIFTALMISDEYSDFFFLLRNPADLRLFMLQSLIYTVHKVYLCNEQSFFIILVLYVFTRHSIIQRAFTDKITQLYLSNRLWQVSLSPQHVYEQKMSPSRHPTGNCRLWVSFVRQSALYRNRKREKERKGNNTHECTVFCARDKDM